MREASADWLIGANGIYRGKPGEIWTLLGEYRFTVNQILREPDGSLTVAAANGLWRVPEDRSAMWVQLHDETLTEAMAIAHSPVGTIAGSPYGVAVSAEEDQGIPRWRSLTEHLRVNARFTNVILTDPKDDSRWIVGTEGGIIVGKSNGANWAETSLNDTPVRSIIYGRGRFLAATDLKGVVQSDDGLNWEPLGDVISAVYAIAEAGDSLLVGSEDGMLVMENDGAFHRTGPRTLTRCLGVDANDPRVWCAGTDPGGLWMTRDAGVSWRNTGVVSRVRDIVFPEGGKA
jgi:photosystem II stability/assembly factor-like uncharacterized protein